MASAYVYLNDTGTGYECTVGRQRIALTCMAAAVCACVLMHACRHIRQGIYMEIPSFALNDGSHAINTALR